MSRLAVSIVSLVQPEKLRDNSKEINDMKKLGTRRTR